MDTVSPQLPDQNPTDLLAPGPNGGGLICLRDIMPVFRLGKAMHAPLLCHVRLFATPWTVAHQAPLSVGFSRQEYWSGLPFPPPGDLSDPGIEFASPASPVLAGGFFTTWEVPPRKGHLNPF